MSHIIRQLTLCFIILALVAMVFAYTTDQASNGKELFVKNCAFCHGANGTGGTVPEQFGKLAGLEAPPLVGPGFLPGMKTVGEVYDFASKNMPANKPGSLKSSEYLDIISFALQANGVKPDGTPLTPDSAQEIKLTAGRADEKASPIFVLEIPPGYRDWRLISVAHEEGALNDIRAILGNDVAIKAYREGKLPFPDGTIIARLAWSYVPSEENNKAFGRPQSFVPGSPPDWYLQFMVKDSKKYAATGGWGFAQFDIDGKPADEAALKTCFPCHQAIKARDLVFTHYAP